MKNKSFLKRRNVRVWKDTLRGGKREFFDDFQVGTSLGKVWGLFFH